MAYSIRGPDDVKNEIGACFYWKRASNGEFRVLKIRPLGPLGMAGASVTDAWKEGRKEGRKPGRKARKYIMISI